MIVEDYQARFNRKTMFVLVRQTRSPYISFHRAVRAFFCVDLKCGFLWRDVWQGETRQKGLVHSLRSIGVHFGCFGRKIDGPGLPGGVIIYQSHLFPPKGYLC